MSSRLFDQGRQAANTGNLELAHRLFVAATEGDASHEGAWLWRAITALADAEKVTCLRRVLELNPGNAQARDWLLSLGEHAPLPAQAAVSHPALTPSAIVSARDVIVAVRGQREEPPSGGLVAAVVMPLADVPSDAENSASLPVPCSAIADARGRDDTPPNLCWWEVLYLALVAGIACYAIRNVLFDIGYLPGADQYGQLLKIWYATRALAETGHIPLWLPQWFSGLDYAEYSPVLYTLLGLPIQLLTWDVHLTYRVLLAFITLVPATGVYLLARRWVSYGAAAVAALAFALSSAQMQILFLKGDQPRALAIAFSPWVLLICCQLLRRPSRAAVAAMATLTAAMILADHTQGLAFLMLLAVFALALGLGGRRTLSHWVGVAVAVFAGGLLSSWWLIPAVTHFDLATIPHLQLDNAADFVATPSIFDGSLWQTHIGDVYFGLPILILALGGLAVRRSSANIAFVTSGLLALLLAFGNNIPFLSWLPLADHLQPVQFLHVSSLYLTIPAFVFIHRLVQWPGKLRLLGIAAALLVVALLGFDQARYWQVARMVDYPELQSVLQMLRDEQRDGRLATFLPLSRSEVSYFPVTEAGRSMTAGWNVAGSLQYDALSSQDSYVARDRADYLAHNLALWNVSQVIVSPVAGGEASALLRNDYSMTQQIGNVAMLSPAEQAGYVMMQDRDVIAIGADARDLTALLPWAAVGYSPYLDDYADDYLASFKLVLFSKTRVRDQFKAMATIDRMLARGQVVIVAAEQPALTQMQGVVAATGFVEGRRTATIAGGDILGDERTISLSPFHDADRYWEALNYRGLDKVLASLERGGGEQPLPFFGYKETPHGRLYYLGLDLLHHAVLNHDIVASGLIEEILDFVHPNKQVVPRALDVDFHWGVDHFSFDYDLSVDTPAIVSVTYSPHWRATINGEPLAYSNHEDLMLVRLPAGQGSVIFDYVPTPVQYASTAVSVAGLLVLLVVLTIWWPWVTRLRSVPTDAILAGLRYGLWRLWIVGKDDETGDGSADAAAEDRRADHKVAGNMPLWIVLLAFPLLTLAMLWQVYGSRDSPPGIDVFGHLFKSWYMLEHFRAYGSVPAWLSHWYNGTPLTQYYPPLAYYVLFGIGIAVRDTYVAYAMFLTVCVLAATLFAYLAARRWLARVPSLIAAVAFSIAPYSVMTALWEGNLPRTLAMVLLPLTLLFAVRLLEGDRWLDFVSLALVLALLVLAHHMSAVAAIAGVIPFAAVYARQSGLEAGRPLRVYVAMATGVALSAWWLVPAVTHIDLTTVPDLSTLPERLASYSTGWNLLDPRTRFDRNGYLGLTIVIGAGLALLGRGHSALKLGCIAAAAVGIVFSLGQHIPLYQTLPFLSQWFPERFLQMSALFLALGVGSALSQALRWPPLRRRPWLIALGLVVLLADLVPGLALTRPTPNDQLERAAIGRLAEWLGTQQNPGRLLVQAAINWETAFAPFSVGGKDQNYGWAPEGSPHTATNNEINNGLRNGYNSLAERTLALWNTRYVVLDRTRDDQMALATALQQQGWKAAGLRIPWLTLFEETPSTPLMHQDRDILVIGRGATTAATLFPWVAQGVSPYVDDYDPSYLAQFKGIWLYDYHYHNWAKAEDLLTELATDGKTIWVDLSSQEGEALFEGPPMPVDLSGNVRLSQIAGDVKLVPEPQSLGPFNLNGQVWRTLVPHDASDFVTQLQGESWGQTFPVLMERKVGAGQIYLMGMGLAAEAMLNRDTATAMVLQTLLNGVAPNTSIAPAAFDAEEQWWQDEAFGLTATVDELTPVIVSVTYTPHWVATIDGQPLPVYNHENLILFFVPSGRHEVRFSYGSSPAQIVGMAISVFALLALIVGCLIRARQLNAIAAKAIRQGLAFLGWT